jgi:folate-binding protein YgfZ
MIASTESYRAARTGAALVERSDRGRIVVTGADRRSYLQGLLTNDIATLEAGHGCYAAYLTAQGRMITDLHVYELGDAILLVVPGEAKDTVLAKLDQFIFSEDVQLGDVTDSFVQVAVIGPLAASTVERALEATSAGLGALGDNGCIRLTFRDQPVIVTRVDDAGEVGFEIHAGKELREGLIAALEAAGARAVPLETLETIRIEGGVPRFGRDMDGETIPLEAGIEDRAISFSKGCYVGQEVIIRVLHRGHGRVARKLVGLRIAGSQVPPAGAPICAGEKEVGHVTSAAWSPALAVPIALGYVQRDFVEPGTSVSVDGVPAVVTARPIVAGAR